MDGHALATLALLVFSGLLESLEWRAHALMSQARRPHRDVERPTEDSPDQAMASPVRLNPIELALIAELSLEMARDNEVVANDATKRPEARRSALEDASAWRERARLFQSQAQRLSARPIVPGERSRRVSDWDYYGPERRRRIRRGQSRRTDPVAASAEVGRGERRRSADRRGRDRREPELAPR